MGTEAADSHAPVCLTSRSGSLSLRSEHCSVRQAENQVDPEKENVVLPGQPVVLSLLPGPLLAKLKITYAGYLPHRCVRGHAPV